MARPTTKVKCKGCGRTVSAILVKCYSLTNKRYPDQTDYFERVIIKNHNTSFWNKQRCRSSGNKFTMCVGVSDGQNPS